MEYEDDFAWPAQFCPRCGVMHLVEDFRGLLCCWCAEDLEPARG